jgi:PPOX class probable FMN-dependent enzyme
MGIDPRFKSYVTHVDQLEELIGGKPIQMIQDVKQAKLDTHARAFLQLSPFALIGTHDAAGKADVSPRGDHPGFAMVLDDSTIVIAERLGNRLADSMKNILATGEIGALFVVPGFGESLRINGKAAVVSDPDYMKELAVADKVPAVAILIKVEEVFVHCARCMLRSELWKSETWPEREAWVTLAQLMMDQLDLDGITLDEMQAEVDQDYRTLY